VKYLPLVFANVGRNRRRSVLTVLALAVPFLLLMTLQTVLTSIDAYYARAEKNQRVVVLHRMGLGFDLPESYRDKLARIPGVVAVCPFTWYGGLYRGSMKDLFSTLSVDPETFRTVWPEGTVEPAALERFRRDRTAVLVDRRLAAKFGWRAGQDVALTGTLRPVDMKFTIAGWIEDSVDPNGFYMHRAYLEEALGRPGVSSDFWLLVDREDRIPDVQRAAEEMFANSSAEVKADREKTFIAMFVSMSGDVREIVGGIGAVVVAMIMVVAANSIAMSVRERTSEVAVMKAIGFSPGTILALILAESAILGTAAGVLGCWGGYAVFTNPTCLSILSHYAGFFTHPLPAAMRWTWMAPLTGIAAGLVPAALAARLRVVDALRKVA
jgi:putative ABC transport system permease protein